MPISKTSSGRTMIETLSVLMIVGVLSIVALVGYSYTMSKLRANNLINDVKLAGFVAVDEMFQHMTLAQEKSLEATFQHQTPYIYSVTKETESSFAIIVTGVPVKVCLKTMDYEIEWVEEIRVNNGTCIDGSNTMTFYFNEILNDQKTIDRCDTDSECGECGKCTNKKCAYGFTSGTKCVSCETASAYAVAASRESCAGCPNRFYNTSSKYCFPCSDSNNMAAYREDCLKCPQRFMPGTEETGTCYICQGTVSSDGTACNWKCPEGKTASRTGCISCEGSGYIYGTTIDSCRDCSNRFYAIDQKACASCDVGGDTGTYRKDCQNCKNRFMPGTAETGACFICEGTVSADGTACDWKCPEGKTASRQGCISCDASSGSSIALSTLKSCRDCPERVYATNLGTCVLCSYIYSFNAYRDDCLNCPNRYWSANNEMCLLCPTGKARDQNNEGACI